MRLIRCYFGAKAKIRRHVACPHRFPALSSVWSRIRGSLLGQRPETEDRRLAKTRDNQLSWRAAGGGRGGQEGGRKDGIAAPHRSAGTDGPGPGGAAVVTDGWVVGWWAQGVICGEGCYRP